MTGLVSAALFALSLTASTLFPPPSPPPAVWPLAPRPEVVTAFDPPGQIWEAGHRGVDLAAQEGQPVRAALPGTVTFAGAIAGRGVVVVDHDARRTTYEPVDASVPVGTDVEAGAAIGTVQGGPGHCFPATCLHWGLLIGSEYVDPLTLVMSGRVRLLPLLDEVRPAGEPGGTRSAGARW